MSIRWTLVFAAVSGCASQGVCLEGTTLGEDGACHEIDNGTDTDPTLGDDDDDLPTDTDTDDTDTDPTTPNPNLKNIDITQLRVGGHFAYDAATNQIVPGLQNNSPTPSQLWLQFANDQFNGEWSDSNNYCLVWYEIDGYINYPFAQVNGDLFGVQVPQGGPAVGGSDCATSAFFNNEDVWTLYSTQGPWAFSIGGDPHQFVQDWLDANIAINDHPLYIGGGFPSEPIGLGLDVDRGIYYTAFDVDNAFNIQQTQMTRSDIDDGYGGLVSGFYRFATIYYWNIE